MSTKASPVWPVNALGEIVVQVGTGSQTITGGLHSGFVPVDPTSNKLVINLPDLESLTLADLITGFVSGAGTVAATDTILQAFNKLDGNNALKANAASAALTGNTSTQARTLGTRVHTAAGDVTVSATDHVIVVKKTSGAATNVPLPAGVLGRTLVIKDGKADASSNNITITPAAGNIDGAATFVMSTDKQAITVVYDGVQWEII